ncbi:MAG: hypothetical protein GW893_04535 [Armatimonadetes bacterium]|nr:hypothetical protein [Armatimonadota bacterium]
MDLSKQNDRRRQLIEKLCRYAMEYYAQGGSFHGPFTQPDERDRFRMAAVLMEHGGEREFALAETLVRGTFGGPANDYTRLSPEENIVDIERGDVRDWNIFQSNIATIMLAKHRSRYCSDVREKLERITRRNLSRIAGSGQPDYIFHGANDNMPSHATAGLIIGGQMLGDEQGVRDGVFRLKLFTEMLSRRGLCAEFASGTYTPITISGMAEIVELADDADIREMALTIEHQLWADVVCHYHPGSGKAAGPQTRAYTVNTIGHLDCIMTLLWMVTGEPDFCDPIRDLITMQPKQVTHFDGDAFKSGLEFIYPMTAEFHFPEHLADLLTDRHYPFRFFGSAEHFARWPSIGGRDVHSAVYQTEDYSLTTSDHGFGVGNQSEKIRIAYRRVKEPQSFRDTGVLYARYLYNDEIPGELAHQDGCAPGEKGLLADHSLGRALQYDNSALFLTRGENDTIPLPGMFHLLRQCVILPAHYHDVESAWIGAMRTDGFCGSSAETKPVFLDLGRLYVALYPLVMTNHGRTDLIRLERVGDYNVVSFINYEGAPRQFDTVELMGTFNGFFATVSGPEESGSFEEFRAGWKLDLVEDWWFANNRRTRVIFEGTELLLNWCAPADTVRSATINGQEPVSLKLWATGLHDQNLPLLTGTYKPMPEVLHLDSLQVAWYPQMTWQIGERRTTG